MSVRFIVCEDTRHSRVLLNHLGIASELVSLPAFAEAQRSQPIIDRILGGADAALITDAGTPAISDPGERLVHDAIAAGVVVVPIPGPSAVITALCASGLGTGRFHFLGFLPRAEGEAKAMLDEVAGLSATLVLYEAPNRLPATLARLLETLGDRPACVAREVTKLHETFSRARLSELVAQYVAQETKGEVVVLVSGRAGEGRWSAPEVRAAIEAGLGRGERLKTLSTEVARQAGWPSGDVYRLGVALKKSPTE